MNGSPHETPPPKPPNCADTKYLSQLRDRDGRLSDVRVIEIEGTALFVPMDWLTPYFVDEEKRELYSSPATASVIAGKFNPDLHKVECPGIAHVLEVGERSSRYGGPLISLRAGGKVYPRSHINPDTLVSAIVITVRSEDVAKRAASRAVPVSFTPIRDTPYPDLLNLGWRLIGRATYYDERSQAPSEQRCVVTEGNPPSEMVASRWVLPTVGLGLVFQKQSIRPEQWRSLCASVDHLFEWLRMAPNIRDKSIRFDIAVGK